VKCLHYAPCATLYFQDLQKLSTWAKTEKLSDQMRGTGKLIDQYLTAYQKVEATRTAKWTDKQITRVDSAIKRNCTLDENNVIVSCKAVRG
jgi:hypothetical protein